MTVADDHLARVGSGVDEWVREEATWASESDARLPGCVREALAFSWVLQPVVGIAIRLGAGRLPGDDVQEDAEWAASVALARREVLALRRAGIDCGLAADNLRLLEQIDALIGNWRDTDWDDLARGQVQGLVDACRRGRQRGRELRQARGHTELQDTQSAGWLLRQPNDHWLRHAASRVKDAECRVVMEAQIARLAPSYDQLCRLNWTAEEAVADVICEMRVLGTPGRWIGWTKPVSAVVTAPVKGTTSVDQQIAVRLVDYPNGPFNGTLVSLLACERWLLCARELADGTLLPLDGSRRLAMPSL